MSCNCLNKNEEDAIFVCTCDEFVHPMPLKIGSGLNELPRQIAGFPEFRRSMLRMIAEKNGLRGWSGTEKDDLGIMLLEMWAYICDSLSFYDKVIADEMYLRTARLRPSVRKLIELLGYLPSPATASFVKLAAIGEGRSSVTIPVGTAFRSGSFNGIPPQVFESDKDTIIHPLTSKWKISHVRPDTILVDNPSWILIEPRGEIKPHTKLLLLDYKDELQNQSLEVIKVEPYIGLDERKYTRLTFRSSARLAKGTSLSRLWLLIPPHKSILLDLATVMETGTSHAVDIMMRRAEMEGIDGDYDWGYFKAKARDSFAVEVMLGEASRPRVDPVQLAIRYGVPTAGTIVNEFSQTLSPANKLYFDKRPEFAGEDFDPDKFAMIDKNQRGIFVNGKIRYDNSRLKLNTGQSWQPDLVIPVDVYGNLFNATRGETVRNEILGSGNAAMPAQRFKLTKKPLTYLLTPTAMNDRGVQSTLRVYVNGIRWREVSSFFGIKPEDEVYIIRQDDEGESFVIFGDGVRGKTLPTGNANITAYYRYGAGKASPPAGNITQIQKSIPGLASIKNPVAAAGGSDAESADNIRTNAPKSALILGRAVSIPDMEAVSLATPGVRTVQAEWHWHGKRQCPVAYIWYIGEEGIAWLLTQRLRNLSDPATPIVVEQAIGVAVSIAMEIEIDPRYIDTSVLAAVRHVLATAGTGMLSPEKLGVGKPLFRSRIFEQVVGVEGVITVTALRWNGAAFNEYGKKPATGTYFDFEKGEIILNGAK